MVKKPTVLTFEVHRENGNLGYMVSRPNGTISHTSSLRKIAMNIFNGAKLSEVESFTITITKGEAQNETSIR